jgi:hypothetical protein
MLYAVRIELSAEDWDQAVQDTGELLAPYTDHSLDHVPTAKLYDLLKNIMRIALRRQHGWLEDHGITAVISPDESGELKFVFYFDNKDDAANFRREFAREGAL